MSAPCQVTGSQKQGQNLKDAGCQTKSSYYAYKHCINFEKHWLTRTIDWTRKKLPFSLSTSFWQGQMKLVVKRNHYWYYA